MSASHADRPRITVLIATRNRVQSLERTLRSVLASEHRSFEIVVVDNAPSDDAARRMLSQTFADAPVHYVLERRPGLARAHNAGLRVIDTPLIAITDDDVEVAPDWLSHLVTAFESSPAVACVTGAIVAAEQETEAQRWVEAHLGFHKGADRRVVDRHVHRPSDPLFPFTPGTLGSGANMAFRTSALRAIGGFDPALGAGTPARGGDDLSAFFEVIQCGYRLVYEPAAIVRHYHHRELDQLERQITGYGVGFGAFLAKVVLDRPWLVFVMARRAALGLRHHRTRRRADPDPTGVSTAADERLRALDRKERLAMLTGPFWYVRSRAATRSERREVFS